MKKIIFLLSIFLFGCSFLGINIEPIAAGVPEFSACREDGEPAFAFTPDVERIYVCGYVETLNPINIDINWYYQEELVFQQHGTDMDGHFYNYIEPNTVEEFPEGDYRIDVLIGGTLANSAHFRVKKP